MRLILGEACGAQEPMPLPSETFYTVATLAPRAAIPLPDNHEDRGIYVISGEVSQGGQSYGVGSMLVFRPGDAISVKAGAEGARIMLLGGAPMYGRRPIWRNFVARMQERIDPPRAALTAADRGRGCAHPSPNAL